MTLATYADLASAIDNYTKRTNTAARTAEWIALCDSELRRVLRVREMELTADLTIVANTQTVALPTGFVGMRRLYLNTSPIRELDYMPPDEFWRKYISSLTDTPAAYTIEGDNVVLGAIPDSAYTAKALYWALTSFTSISAVPSLFTNHPGLYVFGTLIQSQNFSSDGEDPRLPIWKTAYLETLDSVLKSSIRDRAGAGTLRQIPALTP